MSIKWTNEELGIIEEKAEVYTIKQIASILKRRGYERTPIAIYLKLNSLYQLKMKLHIMERSKLGKLTQP
jgi:repressor of nif and glnA expression